MPTVLPLKVNVGVSGTGGTPSSDVSLVTTANPQPNTGFGDLTLQGGTSSATVNSLPGGQYQVTARYGGDNSFASSSSTPVTVAVTPEASTLSLVGKYYDYGSRAIVPLVSGGSYTYGTYIAFDAQASGAHGVPGALDGVPTGTLTFSDASGPGSVGLNLNRTGMAEWVPTAGFSVGSHSVNAGYSGDASFASSAGSTPLNFTMTRVAPAVDLYASAYPIGVGQSTTLIVDVGLGALAAPPTGTVTFNSGNTVLGTSALGPVPYYNPSAAQATLSVSSLPLGTDTVTARYNGDGNYDAVTSNAASITVMQPATVTASVNPPSGFLSQTYIVTANVSAAANLPAPTGAVPFNITGGSQWIGTAQLINGSATFTFDGTTFFPGTVSAAAEYLGDSSYAPFTVIVPVPMTIPFTMSATAVVIPSPGATTGNTSAITITPAAGFTGSVYFTCSLSYYPPGVQHIPTCSVPASINVTDANPVTANMTINSTPPATTAASSLQDGPRWIAAQVGMTFAAFFLLGTSARHRGRWRLASFLTVFLLIAGMIGCAAVATPVVAVAEKPFPAPRRETIPSCWRVRLLQPSARARRESHR
ncbi:MAG TPA: Ig-like domain-containing protein [Candidatus Sulfotelmatobacter sp.]|nr:Ig-like domain-containing protein [Candidatus Sulfotelmatobacter sp.]